jgi:hypothetical protein
MGRIELPGILRTNSFTDNIGTGYSGSFNKMAWQPQSTLTVNLPVFLSSLRTYIARFTLVDNGFLNCDFVANGGVQALYYWSGNSRYVYVVGSGQSSSSLGVSYIKCKHYGYAFLRLIIHTSTSFCYTGTLTISQTDAENFATANSPGVVTVQAVDPSSRDYSQPMFVKAVIVASALNNYITADNSGNYFLMVTFNSYLITSIALYNGGEPVVIEGVETIAPVQVNYYTTPIGIVVRGISKFSTTRPLIIMMYGNAQNTVYPGSMNIQFKLYADPSAMTSQNWGFPCFSQTYTYNSFPTFYLGGTQVFFVNYDYGAHISKITRVSANEIDIDLIPYVTRPVAFNGVFEFIIVSIQMGSVCNLNALVNLVTGQALSNAITSCSVVGGRKLIIVMNGGIGITTFDGQLLINNPYRFTFGVVVSNYVGDSIELYNVFNYYNSSSATNLLIGDSQGTSYTLTTPLATTVTYEQLSYHANTLTEISFSVTNLSVQFGPTDKSILLLALPGASAPSVSVTEAVSSMPCMCDGIELDCLVYKASATQYIQFTIGFYLDYTVSDNFTCRIPGIRTPAAAFTPYLFKSSKGPNSWINSLRNIYNFPTVTPTANTATALTFSESGNPYAAEQLAG